MEELLASGGLVVSGAALAELLRFAGRLVAARNQRTEVSAAHPLAVELRERFVDRGEFDALKADNRADHAALRAEQDKAAETVSRQLAELGRKLDRNDGAAEERSVNLHRRIDPLVSGLASALGSIDNHLADHRAGKQK